MQILIVYPESGWILTRIAEQVYLQRPDIFRMISGSEVKRQFLGKTDFQKERSKYPIYQGIDWIYFVDLQCGLTQEAYNGLQGIPQVGMITWPGPDFLKYFENDLEKLKAIFNSLTGFIHMCHKTYQTFCDQEWGTPDNMIVLPPGNPTNVFTVRKICLGIIQRGFDKGKGNEFIPALIQSMTKEERAHFWFVFKGKGWRENLIKAQIIDPGVENSWTETVDGHIGMIVEIDENEDYRSYANVYSRIDYLLIPSLWEGGPMAYIEALAMGIPVIAADVGWVQDFVSDTLVFPPGDVEKAKQHLLNILAVRKARRAAVQSLNYTTYVENLLTFINHLEIKNE